MNLYLLEQDWNENYDTYDSCVVAAEDEESARNTHPSPRFTYIKDGNWMGQLKSMWGDVLQNKDDGRQWVLYSERDKIKVTLIGVAKEGISAGVICASFNAA